MIVCESPHTPMGGARAYPCGACVACRVATKMIWQSRMRLEMQSHLWSSFVTLTYRDDCLPANHGPLEKGSRWDLGHTATLIPSDLSGWLKRLRIAYQRKSGNGRSVRFFACGEYGDKHERPHYHVALFGYPPCPHGVSRYKTGVLDCCFHCDLVRDTWNRGIVEVSELTEKRCAYTAGYIMKKMTNKKDGRLKGRHPEFIRMSNRPGIGAHYIDEVAAPALRPFMSAMEDVPTGVTVGGKHMKVGRYLRRRWRTTLGRDPNTPAAVQIEASAELLPMLKNAIYHPFNTTLKKQIRAASQGKLASLKARQAMYPNNRKGDL